MSIRIAGEGSSIASCSCSQISSLANWSLCLRDRIMNKMLARIKPSPSPKPTTRPVIIPTFGFVLSSARLTALVIGLLVALFAAPVTVTFWTSELEWHLITPRRQKKDAYTYRTGWSLQSKAINWMCISLSGRRKNHHAAWATVVVLGHSLAEDITKTCPSIARATWSRRIRRMKAKATTIRGQLTFQLLHLRTQCDLPWATSDI